MGYLDGVSIAALARGNRRMLAPLKSHHREAKSTHAEAVAAFRERRAKAREIKDPEARAKALESLRGERPTHPTLVAAGCSVVTAIVGWPMFHGHQGEVIGGGLTLWTLTALILGQETTSSEGSEQMAPEADGEDQGASRPTAPTAAEVRSLTATMTAAEGSLLLTRLTAALASSHPSWASSTKAVRGLLQEAGVRVREGVRTTHGNGPGIHHEDAPAPLSPSGARPGSGVVANVAAGESANANANNASPTPPREGFTTQPDPDNPARTIVVHAA